MSLNDRTCWVKRNLIGSAGTQGCGTGSKEQVFRVLGCHITLAPTAEAHQAVPLTVRVWTNLDEDATDESFGIDNVVISKSLKYNSEFGNANDFEGWNCGRITKCGKYQICGGYNVKGQGSDIAKTFMLPAGTYYVELNFIKIDSWFVLLM